MRQGWAGVFDSGDCDLERNLDVKKEFSVEELPRCVGACKGLQHKRNIALPLLLRRACRPSLDK